MDPRERFTETVEDYRRYRPDYPAALFDWLIEDADLSPGDVVIDVGCGTGISSRQLAARGLEVIGVDANEAMVEVAREPDGHVRYLVANGETLPVEGPVDAIVGGQSFHWLDLDRFLPRCAELLRPEGRVVAFWNLRDDRDPLMAAYERLLLERCPEYAEVGAERRVEAVARHPGVRDARRASFPHAQVLDREGFHGRVWSSSYVRNEVEDREGFDRALDALFDTYAKDGRVRFVYRSVGLSFVPR
jgi:SAM-dependent methyltransferase